MKTGSFNNSENLYAEAVNLMPGGVNSPVRAFKPHPLFIKMGNGSHVFDVDDNPFIDYCMAFGPLILGHAPPEIVEAVRDHAQFFLSGKSLYRIAETFTNHNQHLTFTYKLLSLSCPHLSAPKDYHALISKINKKRKIFHHFQPQPKNFTLQI